MKMKQKFVKFNTYINRYKKVKRTINISCSYNCITITTDASTCNRFTLP